MKVKPYIVCIFLLVVSVSWSLKKDNNSFSDFFKHPISEITLVSSDTYCFGHEVKKVVISDKNKIDSFTNCLQSLLDQTSLNEIPKLSDFDFSSSDSIYIRESFKQNELGFLNSKKFIEKKEEYFRNIKNISDSIFSTILTNHEWRISVNTFKSATLFNKAYDSLTIYIDHNDFLVPYDFPWIIKYKNREINSYNIDLAKCMDYIFPDSLGVNYSDENKYILEKIMFLGY